MILGELSYEKFMKSKIILKNIFQYTLEKMFRKEREIQETCKIFVSKIQYTLEKNFRKKMKNQNFLISIFEMFGFVHNLSNSNVIMSISDFKEK